MLQITKPAPYFSGVAVINGQFQEINSSEYKGKYLVLFFYPQDFTFVCPTELTAFSDRVEEFREMNCEIIGISTDSQYAHLQWSNMPRKKGGVSNLTIPLLADRSGKIARDYFVFNEETGAAFRGLFIIDCKGNLRHSSFNDLQVGRSVDETIRLVQAFRFTDEHGEVCPADWKPGEKTLSPDPEKSQIYFATLDD